jgi:hypothetical protein
MAYTAIPYRAAGDPGYTADQINAWIANNMAAMAPDIFTTKGDLFVATGADVGARLAVGANDQILTADSGQTTGVKWAYDPIQDPITAKGGIVFGTAADTVAQVAVGANNTILHADSAQAAGVIWKIWRYFDIFTTKGDLIAASAADTPARAGYTYDGEYLQALSTASNGVDWTRPFGARRADINTFSALASGTWNNHGYISETWDDGLGMTDTINTYFTCPESGFYLIGGMVTADGASGFDANEIIALRVTVNGVDIGLIGMTKLSANMTTYNPSVNGLIIARLTAGDVVRLEEYHDSGANITPSTADTASQLYAHRLGGNN